MECYQDTLCVRGHKLPSEELALNSDIKGYVDQTVISGELDV